MAENSMLTKAWLHQVSSAMEDIKDGGLFLLCKTFKRLVNDSKTCSPLHAQHICMIMG